MFPMRRAVVRRRPLLRAAVVGGGAYAVGRATARHSAERADQEAMQDARLSDLEQTQQGSGSSDLLDQLNQLSGLHERGALTDEEFAAAKARLLG
jgi:hypothetical protein